MNKHVPVVGLCPSLENLKLNTYDNHIYSI